MTQDKSSASQRAFQEFYESRYDDIDSEFAANMWSVWQASEARIIRMMESEDLKDEIQRIIQTSTVRGSRADMIISAIITRIKGDTL